MNNLFLPNDLGSCYIRIAKDSKRIKELESKLENQQKDINSKLDLLLDRTKPKQRQHLKPYEIIKYA